MYISHRWGPYYLCNQQCCCFAKSTWHHWPSWAWESSSKPSCNHLVASSAPSWRALQVFWRWVIIFAGLAASCVLSGPIVQVTGGGEQVQRGWQLWWLGTRKSTLTLTSLQTQAVSARQLILLLQQIVWICKAPSHYTCRVITHEEEKAEAAELLLKVNWLSGIMHVYNNEANLKRVVLHWIWSTRDIRKQGLLPSSLKGEGWKSLAVGPCFQAFSTI